MSEKHPDPKVELSLSEGELNDIRRSWTRLHPGTRRGRKQPEKEIATYVNGAIFEILLMLTDLEELTKKKPRSSVSRAFLKKRQKMVRELQILSKISSLLFPLNHQLSAKTS